MSIVKPEDIKKEKTRVLIMSASSEIGGAEKVAIDVAGILRDQYDFVLLNQTEGPFSRKFQSMGFGALALSMPAWRKGKNFFSRMRAVFKLIKIVKTNSIDMIHCNSYRLAPYLYWAQRITGVKGFVHLHDIVDKRQFKKFCLSGIENIVAVSGAVAKIDGGDVCDVIHNAVDNTIFYGSDGRTAGKRTVGMVAFFYPQKRHDLFISVSARLRELYPDVRFVIVGGNSANTDITIDTLKAQAEKQGLTEDRLSFTGATDSPADFMRQFDIFLLPSTREPFGLVLIEAMACGCVAFADRKAGGPSEIIEDGKDGFLVDFRDIDGTAARIKKVLEDEDVMGGIRKAALMKIREEYSMEVFREKFSEYYAKILNG